MLADLGMEVSVIGLGREYCATLGIGGADIEEQEGRLESFRRLCFLWVFVSHEWLSKYVPSAILCSGHIRSSVYGMSLQASSAGLYKT